jgi:hypothetical protein
MQIRGTRTSVATVYVIAALLSVSTVCRRSPVATAAESSPAEYDVLSAFIDDKFASRKGEEPLEPLGNGISKIVVLNMSESDESGQNRRLDGNGQTIPWTQTMQTMLKEAPTLQRTTLDAFRNVNAQQAFLRRSLHPSIDYELVSSAQLEPIFCNHCGFWPAYYKQFPGSPGILTFSRVGFSVDGTQALFYLSNHCGDLCGTGMYVVMEKRDGRWTIGKEIEMWIS